VEGSQQPPNDEAALSASFARLRATLAVAAVQPRPWAARVADAIDSLLDFAVAEPEMAAALLTPYLRDCSDDDAQRYQDLIAGLSSLLREGRDESRNGELLPASNEQALAGAIASLVGERLRAGEGEQLAGLRPEIVEFTLAPYIGPAEARRRASIPTNRRGS
jgi:hypothetical protein